MKEHEEKEYPIQPGCVLRVGWNRWGPYSYLVELPSDKGWATELIIMAWQHQLSEKNIEALRKRKWELRGNHDGE